jgi:hypothetical protein
VVARLCGRWCGGGHGGGLQGIGADALHDLADVAEAAADGFRFSRCARCVVEPFSAEGEGAGLTLADSPDAASYVPMIANGLASQRR